MTIIVLTKSLKICNALRVILSKRYLRCYKCDRFLFTIIFTLIFFVNMSNSWFQHDYNGGRFIGEEEEALVAMETNMRFAKIPCNFTTKTNCLYVEKQELILPKRDAVQQSNGDKISVSWVPQFDIINRTDYHFLRKENSRSSMNLTIGKKTHNDFFNFKWISELVACMMLVSLFEICLLVLRNLRNISMTIFGFWSSFNVRLQKLCYAWTGSSPASKSDQQRKRNVPMGEKRTLSYIFAILTWRASQTAKSTSSNTEANLRDENTINSIGYGHVTTMGDLLLLILFTHVYYQRQRFHQSMENDVVVETEELIENHNEENCTNSINRKLYDKQTSSNTFHVKSFHRRVTNKHCSHFCGNMYHQVSSLSEYKTNQVILPVLVTHTNNMPHLTFCSDFLWNICCFCQYSCRRCCYCCNNWYRCSKRWCMCIPLCNTVFCCCLYKFLKPFHGAHCKYYCCLCCWKNFCHLGALSSHTPYYGFCHYYCERILWHCFYCSTNTNKTPARTLSLLLLNKMSNCVPSFSDYCLWKIKCNNNQMSSLLYELNGKSQHLHCVVNGKSIFLYNKTNIYQVAAAVLKSLLPQHTFILKNCQTFLKWRKLHAAVIVMALIVIFTSSAEANNDQHHYYSSLINRCQRHLAKCQQNKRRRRRRRRRRQHCKAYRPQHYFYTTLIQCVKRQKNKKLPKRLVNIKLHKTSSKLLTATTTTYEYSLAPTNGNKRSIRRVSGSTPNIVWLLIGLIWFEGPKIVNCNVIINYQNQQQHEQQQPQTGSKETSTINFNSNIEYKIENYQQMKAKNCNNNNNNNDNNINNNNNSNSNKNKNNKNSSNSSNNNSNNTTNSHRRSATTTSSNIHLSVNVIPIINSLHFKQSCNSNYHFKLIRTSLQRVQRALKTKSNLDSSIISSASFNYNNTKQDLDLDLDRMPSSSPAYQAINEERHAQSDLMRLESIKHQILFKLGLTRKPNVSHPLPKQFIWDTIYRADGIKSFHEFASTNNFGDQHSVLSHQSDKHWSAAAPAAKTSSHSIRSNNLEDSEDGMENIDQALESINIVDKKYGSRNKQKHQTHSKHYINNDINNYLNGASITSTSKNLNKLLYTTNRNTNKMANNFTMFKQSKHQQFNKSLAHSTKSTIIHHQQNRTHNKQTKKYTNNFQNNKKNNRDNNNDNNVNNSNNNIIMVQKHLRNDNNKYIEEAKKFTYLTDINSSEDSLNNMEYHNPDFDDNIRIVRKHTQHGALEEPSDSYQFNTDNGVGVGIGSGSDVNVMNIGINADSDIIHDVENYNSDDEADNIYQQSHYHNHHSENYFPKLDAFDENDDYYGRTQEIITFAEKGKMYKNHRLVEFSYQYNEKPKQKLNVRNAQIHIRIDRISARTKSKTGSGIKRKRLKIWIFQLIENNYAYKGFDHVAQFCASFEVDTSQLGWKKFDITTTVKEWYARRESAKLRLLIDCTGCGKMYFVHLFNDYDKRRIVNVNENNNKQFYNVTTHSSGSYSNFPYNRTIIAADKDKMIRKNGINKGKSDEQDVLNSSRPFLVLHTETRKQRRVRRRAINCNGALHGQCCKESFYVSFKALGWDDWIIAPRGYFANYCRGDCTGPYRTPDTFQTFHAHFIEEYRKMGLLNGMQPCCAPIKFSSMSLIYYGDEGIIKRDLPKMVVDECGCP